ncbi:MAG: hypothetical protein ACRDRJ_18285 [Streptosporangiaceae bacterium]
MDNEVIELLAALKSGNLSLDQVALRFRERSWPRTKPARSSTYLEYAAREQEDPDPYVPGSFDDVAAAFHSGDLTRPQYRILADAAAESMRAEDRRGADEGAGA